VTKIHPGEKPLLTGEQIPAIGQSVVFKFGGAKKSGIGILSMKCLATDATDNTTGIDIVDRLNVPDRLILIAISPAR